MKLKLKAIVNEKGAEGGIGDVVDCQAPALAKKLIERGCAEKVEAGQAAKTKKDD